MVAGDGSTGNGAAPKFFGNLQRGRKWRLNFTSALTPAPWSTGTNSIGQALSPEERESRLRTLENVATIAAVAVLLAIEITKEYRRLPAVTEI
jgi:hypothetical protein